MELRDMFSAPKLAYPILVEPHTTNVILIHHYRSSEQLDKVKMRFHILYMVLESIHLPCFLSSLHLVLSLFQLVK
jgi:hypothetical protein